ncbi:MAG: TadE/TadG family type IV pilus assembly protein [Phycisphaerae bacterium]
MSILRGRQIRRGRWSRRGAAAVEMAVVTPLLLTMVFGIIEYGWVFTIRQSLTNAAREGARIASLPGSTDTEIQTRVAQYLQPLGLTTYTANLTRATVENPIETVHVTIPYSDVTLIGAYFGSTNYNLGATCSMRKEGLD